METNENEILPLGLCISPHLEIGGMLSNRNKKESRNLNNPIEISQKQKFKAFSRQGSVQKCTMLENREGKNNGRAVSRMQIRLIPNQSSKQISRAIKGTQSTYNSVECKDHAKNKQQ